MLKVSTKSTYAIRALTHLAKYANGNAIRAADISDQQNIPEAFLEQIFSKLKKAKIVEAIRGPHGGFKLARNPNEITLADIIFVLEGPFEPVMCTQPENKTKDCHVVEGCSSRIVCNELDGAIIGTLSKHTIGSMTRKGEHSEPERHINIH